MESGLIVSVYRNARHGDCTNKGWSSQHNEALLLLPEGGPFKPADHPELIVIKLVKDKPYFYVTKVDVPINSIGSSPGMYGGNFVYCCDSRFPNRFPIPIHDRFED